MFSFDISNLATTLKETSFQSSLINRFFKSSATYNSLLLKNTPTKFIKLDKAGRIFRSDRSLFIRSISIYFENPDKKTESLKVSIMNQKGELIDSPGTRQGHGDRVVFFPESFSSQFEIKYSGIGIRPKATKIEVFGLDFESIEKQRTTIARFFDAAFQVERELAKASTEIETLSSTYSELKENIERDTNLLTVATAELEEKQNKISELVEQSFELSNNIKLQRDSLKGIAETEIQKNNNIEQLDKKTQVLNIEIADRQRELSAIINDRNLISDEYKDYVREGKSQSRIYGLYLAASLAIAIIALSLLYTGAKDLLVHPFEDAQGVFASFILRLPFAAVMSGTLLASLALARFMFRRILSINEERLTLAKLLILAKETVFSTAEATNISADEKFRTRVEVKLEMLKAYLANSLGNFSIKLAPNADDKNVDSGQATDQKDATTVESAGIDKSDALKKIEPSV